jgi:TRAP-type mannitol/chloroaromatic compound transport system permease small subunit
LKISSLARFIDAFNTRVGHIASWMTLTIVLVTIFDVIMRYIFKSGTIWIQELEWHLFAANFMLAASWTLIQNGHVRVDIFYVNFHMKTKQWINLVGSILFLLPYCVLIVYASMPFVMDSWSMLEGSSDPGGLPGRFIIKSVIPLTFLLLALQGISEIIKNILLMTKKGE